MTTTLPPNQTLYIQNLNDKIRKGDLRQSLYMLFATYGIVLDVVALKTPKQRGQAHIAFRDVPSASQAMRALQGFNLYGKELVSLKFLIDDKRTLMRSQRISFAKGKSHIIAKLDGTFMVPKVQHDEIATPFVALPGSEKKIPAEAVTGSKRVRADDDDGERSGKQFLSVGIVITLKQLQKKRLRWK